MKTMLQAAKLARMGFGIALLLAARWTLAQNLPIFDDSQIEHLTARSQQGYVEDELKLATAFQFGLGVAPDQAQAAHWFLRAAGQGNPIAETETARRYL